MSSHKQPLVSVVTPFYNTERYLAEAIESVLAQDFTEFEYILMNNASTDSSGEIAAAYADRDPRIKYIHESEFLSQLPNYNRALSLIAPNSKYVKIVQADDRILPRCITELVKTAESDASVGIVGSLYAMGDSVCGSGLPTGRRIFDGREVCRRHLFEGIFVFGSPTTLLYRADIVRARQEFFDPRCLHADTEICYQILHEWNLGYLLEVLSWLRTQADSITGEFRDFDPNTLDKYIIVHKYGSDFLNEAELHECKKRENENYLSYLAQSVFDFREMKFWRYHLGSLKQEGISLPSAAMTKHLFLQLIDFVFNPKKSVGRIFGAARRMFSSRAPHSN